MCGEEEEEEEEERVYLEQLKLSCTKSESSRRERKSHRVGQRSFDREQTVLRNLNLSIDFVLLTLF